MRTLWIIILILFCSVQLRSQFVDVSAFNEYEIKKKDKMLAFYLSTILPGAGLWYAESYTEAVFFFVATSVTAAMLINAIKKGDIDPVRIIFFLFAKGYEISGTFNAVSKYNLDLRRRLHLVPDSFSFELKIPI